MGAAYARNKHVDHQYQVSDLTGTVMLFESENGGEGDEYDVWQLHHGGSNYVFWDGHAKWTRPSRSSSPSATSGARRGTAGPSREGTE